MSSLRILVIGGLTSYRALFNWLTPWVLIPTFVLEPIFQLLLFVYIGRTAGVGSDTYFVVGNAMLSAAIPCLFAMGNTIGGERNAGTLPLLLASPAKRIPLFLGRALPVILNGFLVSAVAMATGSMLLNVRLPLLTWVPIAVCAVSCTGLGLLTAAIALRVRETAVLSNIIFGILLIFAGVNVPLMALPGWMSAIAQWLPMKHGLEAARSLAAGASLTDVGGELGAELGLGAIYAVVGLILLSWLERESRRKATLDSY